MTPKFADTPTKTDTALLFTLALFLIVISVLAPARASESNDELERIREQVERYSRLVDAQAAEIERQRQELDQLRQQLTTLIDQPGSPDTPFESVPVVADERETSPEASEPLQSPYIIAGHSVDEQHRAITGEMLASDDFPGSWPLFGTDSRLRIGGYIKADGIYDFDGHGDEYQFLLGQIAVDGSPQSQADAFYNMHARETRFNLDYRQTTDDGTPMQAFVEFDFFGSSPTFLRLRHAYGVYGNWLAGQSWTTVSELRALPFMVDFAFGDALFGGRTTQLRYQKGIGTGLEWAVALENPNDVRISNPYHLPGTDTVQAPSLAAKVSRVGEGGLFTLGAQLQQLHWDGYGSGAGDSALGWAIIAAGRHNLGDRAFITGTASYSDGYSDSVLALGGRGASATITPNGLETDDAISASVGFGIDWNPTWSSNLHLAWLDRSGTSLSQAGEIEDGGIAHINAIWRPLPQVRAGLEFIWGTRSDLDGASGDGRRLMAFYRYDFGLPY